MKKNILTIIGCIVLAISSNVLWGQTQVIKRLKLEDDNTITPMSKDALIQMDSNDKGMLLPRVALTDAKKPTPLSEHTAGMTVYNTATVSSTADIEGVEPGYYYNNGTKWVRLTDTNDQEWVYDPATKQVNLKRSAGAPFINRVYYDERGLLKNYTDETYEYWDSADKSFKISSGAAKLTSNYLQRNSQSLVPTLNSPLKSKYFTNSLLVADETTSDVWNFFNGSSSIITKKNNVANYRSLTASGMGVNHQGKGDVKYLIGSSSWASLIDGAKSSGYLVGVRAGVNLYGNSTADEMSGIRTYNVDWGNGTISSLEGAHHLLSFEENASSTIDNILGVAVHPVAHSNSNSQVENIKAFYYNTKDWKSVPNTVTVKNEYGVYLDDVTKGVENNYAIYTNKGRVRLGDYMIAGKNIHNAPILDSESNILDQTIIVNNNEERSYSSVAGFYRLAPTNEVTEAPYINFAHQAPNESVARRGGYIKGGLVFDNSTTPTGGYMEIQSCFGPASHTDWTLTGASKTKILINPEGGNVGIGTKDPKAKLDVNDGRLAVSSGGSGLDVSGVFYIAVSDEPDDFDQEVILSSNSKNQEDVNRTSIFIGPTPNGVLAGYGRVQLSGGDVWVSSGNMRIGKQEPATEKLEVEGKVKAKGFISTVDNKVHFPDYVFENYYNGSSELNNEYGFMSLPEVEAFTKANNHLPGYESASAIAEKGSLDIVDVQLKNVEKIEELYLHLIEKEKEVENLKSKLQEQEERLQRLEKLLDK